MATSNVDQESKWTDTFPCLQKCTYFHDVVQRLWQIANDSTTSCEFSVEEPGENKDDNQTLGQYYSINYYCKKGIVVLYATLSFHLECNYPQRLEIQQGMAVPVNDLVIWKAIKQNKSADKTRETLQVREPLKSHI